jgi:hypothetical protein
MEGATMMCTLCRGTGAFARGALLVMTLALAAQAHVATARAAPPPNDNRANAQLVALARTVTGTTAGASVEAVEPLSGCGPTGPSVWYRVDAATSGRVIALVDARGDLDVVVDVFLRERSQTTPVTCDVSDRRGQSSTDFTVGPGQSYLVRVAQQPQSGPGTFTLTVGVARPLESPPGARLPDRGGNGSVQRVFAPGNAWSTVLREGRTYRINLASEGCLRLSIYAPGTTSFDDAPVQRIDCRGYTVLTPAAGEGGRYSLLVQPVRARDPRRYHLQVGLAGPDDTTPGTFLHNHVAARGSLDAAHLDVVDLYRFDVVRTSITQLRLDAGARDFSVRLLTERGHSIARGEDISVRTRPGRYYAVVRAGRGATGGYRLHRASRTITHTRLSPTPAAAGPGATVTLTASIQPAEAGPVVMIVERFDPLAGYQFTRAMHVHAFGGRAVATFAPPSVGIYRARATFVGTKLAATSGTGWRSFTIQGPLTE